MPFIHKNLTPFYWGPKATSRKPPQVEAAMCVRGTFRLRPGQPLEAIEDRIEQGFMTGDVFDPADVDRTGALLYASDFADWKPNADLLLKGTCYPPRGADVACEVRFAVGAWSKTLRVVGSRTFTPGMLFGGSVSDPEPFTHMPLTWDRAYGGEGYALNPVGRGYAAGELPNVERPDHPVTKQGQKRVVPGCFGPISPNWPQRAKKIGKQWGASWERSRKPFYAEDFDWTYFNAAPEDQQLDGYLQGDEELVFENLHPHERVWRTRLPGLRVRVVVRDDRDVIRDVPMVLDTVYADLDAGRLYLTWRGLTPVRELDLTCLASAVIASEPLAEAPLPLEHYQAILEAFEDDPVGLKEKFPPGFLEAAQAIEAAEIAERDGTPPPDLKALAANLPAGCPFPPWFLAAAAGDPDPLGIKAAFPRQLLDPRDPLGLAEKLPPGLAQVNPQALGAAFQGAAVDPTAGASALERLAEILPPQAREGLLSAAADLRAGVAKVRSTPEAVRTTEAGAAAPPPPAEPPFAQIKAAFAEAERGLPASPEAAQPALEKLRSAPQADAILAKVLAPLDDVVLPPLPEIPDTEAHLAGLTAKLEADEAKLRERGIDHPLLGLFALGHRLIKRAPRPSDVPTPDMTPLLEGCRKAEALLLEQGAAPEALAPLTRFNARFGAYIDGFPPQAPAPERRDFAYGQLAGRDLSGQDLRGKSFARAELRGANLSRADLREADLREAILTGADLSGANLAGANLTKAQLGQARLTQADLSRATLEKASLQEADLSGARLVEVNAEAADLQGARLPQAVLAGANLTDAVLQGADLTEADLSGAQLTQARAMQAVLARARLTGGDLRFAELLKADLRAADLSGVDLSLANLSKARADAADLSGARLDMIQLTKARLQGAKLVGARAAMGSLAGSNLTGADLRQARLEKVDLSETVLDGATFEEATLHGCTLRDVRGHEVSFLRADLEKTSTNGKSALTGCNFALLRGPRSTWLEVDLSGSDFSYADLEEALFQGSHGEEVNFFAANLRQAQLRKTRWTRSRFVRADLCKAHLDETLLVDDQFTGANCYDAKFVAARLATCDFLEANLSRAFFERAEGEVPR